MFYVVPYVVHPTTRVTLLIPILEQKCIHDIHKLGRVLETTYEDEGVRITVEIAREDMATLEQHLAP